MSYLRQAVEMQWFYCVMSSGNIIWQSMESGLANLPEPPLDR